MVSPCTSFLKFVVYPFKIVNVHSGKLTIYNLSFLKNATINNFCVYVILYHHEYFYDKFLEVELLSKSMDISNWKFITKLSSIEISPV